MTFPEYPDSPIALEEDIQQRWREEQLFERTLRETADGEEFVFFEGPPTANGRPGIHHVISRTIKDLVCRYQTMRGRHVTRMAGWDTHGLPVEIEAEKKLGISGKRQIEEIGVARFNEVCRESVFTYKEEWERLSERIGYWLDHARAYVTFLPPYIESVWWILKQLAERDLIYRGYKSVPYCPRCGTALSSHEVALGYAEVEDPSLYFLAPFAGPEGADDPEGRAFLVWTTTPWTLPANTALALHPDITYAEVEWEGWRLVLAEPRVVSVLGEDVRIVRRYTAAELEGQRYRRPFDLIAPPAGSERAWQVVLESFVTAEDGTGIVHLAPAFGADDYASGQRHGFPMMRPIDDAGCFLADTPLVGGQFVKAADPVLAEDLLSRGLLFRHGRERHSYPHCWRCSSPLLYMARDSWYIRTTACKEAMIANNRMVSWHPPEMGSGRFGEWLEGNVDWAISRERYWGTPLPIWVCDADAGHIEVIGSLEELRNHAGGLPADFDPHKPYIDEPTWACASCGGTMRRTPEVIDVWFDSGSMPYAQWHYPFEGEASWTRHFPADFICEGVDQTRGWFYSLMAISTMLGHGPAFRNVVVNDLVLDADGQKMSKSRGNTVDPWEAIASFGADAMRWYFVTGSQPWVPKRYDPAALGESAHRTFDTLANTYRFFSLYANLEGWAPDGDPAASGDEGALLDRWVLSRVGDVARRVSADLDGYEITRAARAISDFIIDDLSNWYVRRSRGRFWGSADADDTRAAFATLHATLTTVARMLAPVVPFHADWLHRALTGESVHLAHYPQGAGAAWDEGLDAGMAVVRELSRLGRAARERVKLRVRQPLRRLFAVVPDSALVTDALLSVLRDELNVKEIEFLAAAEELVTYRAQPNFRALGARFGKRTPQVAERIRGLSHDELQSFRRVGRVSIDLDGGEVADVAVEEMDVIEEPRGELVVEGDGVCVVALDPTLDTELRLEGLARELVNRIQRLRRESDFAVSDRIRLGIGADGEVCEAARQHRDYIAEETLATWFEWGDRAVPGDFPVVHEVEVDGHRVSIGLDRA